MIEHDLDAMERYAEIRAESGLGPHSDHDADDLALLHFFLSGVISGTRATLMKVKEGRGK